MNRGFIQTTREVNKPPQTICGVCLFLEQLINGRCRYCIKENIYTREEYETLYPKLEEGNEWSNCKLCGFFCPKKNTYCSHVCYAKDKTRDNFFKVYGYALIEQVDMPQVVDEEGNLHDIDIPDDNTREELAYNDILRLIKKLVKPKAFEMFMMELNGIDVGVIAKKFKCSFQNVHKCIKDVKKIYIRHTNRDNNKLWKKNCQHCGKELIGNHKEYCSKMCHWRAK